MKRFYFLLALVSFALNTFADEWTDENGVTWSYSISSNRLAITGASPVEGDLVCPKYINGRQVRVINETAFSGCSNLTSIILPEDLWIIEECAFYKCSNLTSITLPGSLTSIGRDAFSNCSSLTSITIPNSVTSIGERAFWECSNLTSITIPNSVTSIGDNAFIYCNNVKEVNINISNPYKWSDQFGKLPNVPCHLYKDGEEVTDLDLSANLTEIPDYAFFNCSSLISITLPKGITTIGRDAFSGCSFLSTITLQALNPPMITSSNLLNDKHLIIVPSQSLNLYKKATGWADYSHHIIADNAITDINDYEVETVARENGSGLHQAIGEENLPNVVNLKISGTINSYDILLIRNKMLNLKALDLTDAVILPNSHCYLDNYCSESNVIGAKMFYGLNLVSVKLPKSISRIGEKAFADCDILRECSINSDLDEIGPYAFENTSLLKLEINGDIGEIGTYAFHNTYIPNFYLGKCKKIGALAFDNTKMTMLKIQDVESIYDGAFDKSNIDSLIVGGVISIEEAFCYYMKGRYVEIRPAKNTYIALPDLSFLGSSINEVVLGKGFTTIGKKAFYDAKSIEEIILPEGLKTICYMAFAGCKNLKSLTLPQGLISIEGSAFSGCESLSSVILPEGLTDIGSGTFYGCKKLRKITFPSTLTQIGSSAFYDCTSLKQIRLPFLTKLESSAFQGCTSLKEVKLPSSLETIGENAFNDCDSVESVYTYTLEPISIGTSTFSQKSFQNATLYVPETSYYTYYFNTEWSQFLHLKQFSDTYDYFYLDKDYLIDDETGTVKGRPNADLNAESGLIVKAKEDVQTLGNVVMDQKEDGTSASIIAEADNIEIDTLTVQLKVEAGKWIFYTPTKDVKISDCQYPGQYVWYDYDGAQRATSGTGWTKLSADTDMLEAGHGYILQSDVAGTLTLHYIEPTFGEDIEVALETHDSENVADANWNLTGNPYTSYYDLVDDDYDAPIITWNVKQQTYEAFRPGDDDCHLQPGQAFFVQKVTETAAVTFSTERRETYTESQVTATAQAKARRAKGINPRRSLINLTLSSDNIETDRTRVVLNQDATLDYDMGADASKFVSTNAKAQLFTIDERGSRYSINERPAGDVPVGYIAKEEGMLTISAPRMDRRMMLLDRETNMTHDLSTSDYNFSTKAGTFTNRFVLYMPSVPTDVANLAELTGVVLGTQTGGISIGNAEGKTISVYTLGGQLMGNHTGNGFISLPHGVYVVKVEKASAKITVK